MVWRFDRAHFRPRSRVTRGSSGGVVRGGDGPVKKDRNA